MICSLCMYLNVPADEGAADTVINGQAVCIDHAGYVAGGEHSRALAAVVRDLGFESLSALQVATSGREQGNDR